MARERPSGDRPTEIGWYIVWRKGTERVEPHLYFCVEASVGQIECMSARPADGETFTSLAHACFHDVLWHGPFKTRMEAQAAMNAVA